MLRVKRLYLPGGIDGRCMKAFIAFLSHVLRAGANA